MTTTEVVYKLSTAAFPLIQNNLHNVELLLFSKH